MDLYDKVREQINKGTRENRIHKIQYGSGLCSIRVITMLIDKGRERKDTGDAGRQNKIIKNGNDNAATKDYGIEYKYGSGQDHPP